MPCAWWLCIILLGLGVQACSFTGTFNMLNLTCKWVNIYKFTIIHNCPQTHEIAENKVWNWNWNGHSRNWETGAECLLLHLFVLHDVVGWLWPHTPAVGEPSKPMGVTATSSTETSFTVSWSCPASASQPVERFNVVVHSDTSSEVRQFVHTLDSVHFNRVSTSYEVGDLVPGTMYFVEISAVNEAGKGETSEPQSFWTVAARECMAGFTWGEGAVRGKGWWSSSEHYWQRCTLVCIGCKTSWPQKGLLQLYVMYKTYMYK